MSDTLLAEERKKNNNNNNIKKKRSKHNRSPKLCLEDIIMVNLEKQEIFKETIM